MTRFTNPVSRSQSLPAQVPAPMLGASLDLTSYLDRLNGEVARLNQADIQQWADLVFQAWEKGRFVFIIGNGGSATTASHMAEDLGKSSLRPDDLKDESK